MASVARWCCCGGDCVAADTTCEHCDDVTPEEYTVVFSSVSLCECFFYVADDVSILYLAGFDLNGSHTLTHDDGCGWSVRYTDKIRYQAYTDDTCTTEGESVDYDVEISLSRSATEWTLTASVENGGFVAYLFYDIQTADVDGEDQLCATAPSFTSDLTTCGEEEGPALSDVFATGGTATVACV